MRTDEESREPSNNKTAYKTEDLEHMMFQIGIPSESSDAVNPRKTFADNTQRLQTDSSYNWQKSVAIRA